MTTAPDYPNGTKVRFLPGPRSTATVDGTVVGSEGQFLRVRCADKERKVRSGSCTKI